MTAIRGALGSAWFFLEVLFSCFLSFFVPCLPSADTLLQWALTSSILILAVLALRAALGGRLSCRVRYALWAVVLVRLLLPFQLPIALSWSAASAVPSAPASWKNRTVPVFPSLSYGFEDAASEYRQLEPGDLSPSTGSAFYVQRSDDGQTMTTYVDLYSPGQIVQSVWWVGTLVLAAVLLCSNLRFARKLRKTRRRLELDGVPLPVYTAPGLPSPCLFGPRPAIYLTQSAAGDETARRHVLAHELTHYAHRDHIWSLLRCLCLALHWYNPLVWLAAVLSKRDGELACDEGAVRRLGEEERLGYGRTLVNMVARRSQRPGDLFSCSTAMAQGKKSIQQRVTLLVKRPETRRTALFAAVALAALAAVFVFTGKEDDHYAGFSSRAQAAQSMSVQIDSFSAVSVSDPDILDHIRQLLAQSQQPVGLSQPGSGEAFTEISFLNGWHYRLYDGEDICRVYLDQDGALVPAALLPAGTAGLLRFRACQQYAQLTSGPASSPLTAEAEEAIQAMTSLRYSEGPASSYYYPEITDPDLVEQAKEVLLSESPYDFPSSTAYSGSYAALRGSFSSGETQLSLAIFNPTTRSRLSSLARRQEQREQQGEALSSQVYVQAMEQLLPRILEDSYWSQACKQPFDLDKDSWNGWLSEQLEQLGFSPDYNSAEDLWTLALPGQAGSGQIDIPGDSLSCYNILYWSADPTHILFSVNPQDPSSVVHTFAEVLAQMYLDLDPRHPKAVSSAQVIEAEIYAQSETTICANITLAIDPVEPNTIFWMAGAGIGQITSGPFAGLWEFQLEYRLELQSSGGWRCTEAATGGLVP